MKPQFTTEEHWKYFAEFVKYEMMSGGPDSQIPTMVTMSEGVSQKELIWRCGCLLAVWNVPYGEILWTNWNHDRILREPELLLPWLEENWKGIVTRGERKCVRIPTNMAQYLIDFSQWVNKLDTFCGSIIKKDNYLVIWDHCQANVKFLGRYIALKLLWFLERYCNYPLKAPDIRPKNGWSPRITLSVLFPEHKVVLVSKDESSLDLLVVNNCVDKLREKLATDYNLYPDMFQTQVMLCEYRESFERPRQHPGHSLDSELSYFAKADAYWHHKAKSKFFTARAKTFDPCWLGEFGGWQGGRKDCAATLIQHRYLWNDFEYDYAASKSNLARPVRRSGGTCRTDRKPIRVVEKGRAPVRIGVAPTALTIYQVIDNLYISAKTHPLSLEHKQQLVSQLNISTVVNLWHTPDKELQPLVKEYIHISIPDGRFYNDSEITKLVNHLVQRVKSGSTVLAHCYGGRNRSGLIVALIVRALGNLTGKQAMEWVQARRPKSLVNEHFNQYLMSLDAPATPKNTWMGKYL